MKHIILFTLLLNTAFAMAKDVSGTIRISSAGLAPELDAVQISGPAAKTFFKKMTKVETVNGSMGTTRIGTHISCTESLAARPVYTCDLTYKRDEGRILH